MDKLAVWNLSHTVNYTALCRSIFDVFSLRPIINTEYWRLNPDTDHGSSAECQRWHEVHDLIDAESEKYIKLDAPPEDEQNRIMIDLWTAIRQMIDVEYVMAVDAVRATARAQTAGNAPRIDSTT